MDNKMLMSFSDNHLCYEIQLFYAALELFARHNWDPRDAVTLSAKNLFLEGVVTHWRCLYEFLYFNKSVKMRKSDDALAGHFFDSFDEWQSVRPSPPEYFVQFFNRANKEILHLTYTRMSVTEITKAWNFSLLAEDMFKVLSVFIENADSRKLHASVKQDLDSCWKRIQAILPPKIV